MEAALQASSMIGSILDISKTGLLVITVADLAGTYRKDADHQRPAGRGHRPVLDEHQRPHHHRPPRRRRTSAGVDRHGHRHPDDRPPRRHRRRAGDDPQGHHLSGLLTAVAAQYSTGTSARTTDGFLPIPIPMYVTVTTVRPTVGIMQVTTHLQSMIGSVVDHPTVGLFVVTAAQLLGVAIRDATPLAVLQIPAIQFAVASKQATPVGLLTVTAQASTPLSRTALLIGQLQIVGATHGADTTRTAESSGVLQVALIPRSDMVALRQTVGQLEVVTHIRLPFLGDEFLSADYVCVVWNDALHDVVTRSPICEAVTATPVCDVVGVR